MIFKTPNWSAFGGVSMDHHQDAIKQKTVKEIILKVDTRKTDRNYVSFSFVLVV